MKALWHRLCRRTRHGAAAQPPTDLVRYQVALASAEARAARYWVAWQSARRRAANRLQLVDAVEVELLDQYAARIRDHQTNGEPGSRAERVWTPLNGTLHPGWHNSCWRAIERADPKQVCAHCSKRNGIAARIGGVR